MKKTIHLFAFNFLMIFSAFASVTINDHLEKETQLNIYPNPVMSGQEISVDMELNEQELVHLYVYDFSGRLVIEFEHLRTDFGEALFSKKWVIDEKGMYFLKILIEDKNTALKKSKVKKLYVI